MEDAVWLGWPGFVMGSAVTKVLPPDVMVTVMLRCGLEVEVNDRLAPVELPLLTNRLVVVDVLPAGTAVVDWLICGDEELNWEAEDARIEG